MSMGDSTIAGYADYYNVQELIESAHNHHVLALSGATISQQKTAWQGFLNKAKSAWVVIQIGINDLNPAESAPVAIARLQELVETVQVDVPELARVFVSKMTPVRKACIAVYGAIDGEAAYQKWLLMNEAIAGDGATPITGVDGRITAHESLMNDGSGNLKAEYDTGDGAHPNNAGRAVNAQAWEDALIAAGVTV